MKGRRVSFPEKIQSMMERSGRSYHQCCSALGARGGRAAAAKRQRMAQERQRQEAMGFR